MEHWEFLLQKEGDRSWLPLDAPDVEILEGRYRIVARSSRPNIDIDIRISHLATEAVPPKKRVQRRSCSTNAEGLMVVIPFTWLEPGLWELSCSPADLMSDLLEGARPYAVKLQVFAKEAEGDEWEPDWTKSAEPNAPAIDSVDSMVSSPPAPTETATVSLDLAAAIAPATTSVDRAPEPVTAADAPAALPPEVAEILGASMDRLFQIVAQMSEQLVDEVLQDFDLTTLSAPVAEPLTPSPSLTPDVQPAVVHHSTPGLVYTLAPGECFTLTLAQEAVVAVPGETVTLDGAVTIASLPEGALAAEPAVAVDTSVADAVADPWDTEDAPLNLTEAVAQGVQLCLRDPQSLQVLLDEHQPLPTATPPFAFTFSFTLPEPLTTHLILGEVLLCGEVPAKAGVTTALVTQAFTITVDPSALVGALGKLQEALAAEIEDEDRIDLPLELSTRVAHESEAAPLSLSFLNLVPPAETVAEPAPRFPSLAGQPLPPQIYRPDPARVQPRSLDLPAFRSTAHTISITLDPAAPATTPDHAASPVADAVVEATTVTPNPSSSDAVSVAPPAVAADPVVTVDPPAEPMTPITPLAAESGPPTGDRPATVSLELPSPTEMSFQALKLQDRFLNRLASLATDTELSAQLRAKLAPTDAVAPISEPLPLSRESSQTHEIVVDDDPLPPLDRTRAGVVAETVTPTPSTPASDAANPLVLPADEPVPMPAMTVTSGELVAGKPITVRVKLPSILPRIYVKLWVIDRQTRSMLDGPRWLVDFLPNGLGDLEAVIPLTVPFGSLAIRFEAIAVEIQTQRESHKVVVDRAVVPPDLPIVSLDDFDA